MEDQPPPPMEWHPYYRDKTYLWDWLNGHDWHIRVPVTRVPRLRFEQELNPYPTIDDNILVLTKEKAWGFAPYVGRPFIYVWYVATDQYKRSITGESWIQYLDPHLYNVFGGMY